MAAQFCPLINQAAATVPNLRASMVWKTPDAIAQLFPGPGPHQQEPLLAMPYIRIMCKHELPVRAQVDTRPDRVQT
jgi:hypothetical protein